MLFHSYLKNGIVYVPTVAKLTTGAYLDIDPVAVESIANTVGLHRAFLDAIARKNAIISPPPKGKWPSPAVLKYAGTKSWPGFARDMSMWSIEENNGTYQITGYREHPDGYLAPDRSQTINFPAGTKVDTVIDRMIAILQRTARQEA
jgi:hypothetical protein